MIVICGIGYNIKKDGLDYLGENCLARTDSFHLYRRRESGQALMLSSGMEMGRI